MAKPTDDELNTAIHMAKQMKEKGTDSFFIAKVLLSHNYRIQYLEKVFKAADHYLNTGMSDRERIHLLKIIEKTKKTEAHTAQQKPDRFGLE